MKNMSKPRRAPLALSTTALLLASSSLSHAVLALTVGANSDGNAVISVSGSGSTVSGSSSSFDDTGAEDISLFVAAAVTSGVANFADTGLAGSGFEASGVYLQNDFTVPGFSVTLGPNTYILNRFEFEDDGASPDDFSLGFGTADRTAGTALDTSIVAPIVVNTTGFQLLSDASGNPIPFAGNFINNPGFTFNSTVDDFWDGI